MPRRLVAGFSILLAVLLATAWLRDILGATLAGSFGWPRGEAAVKHVVHALDLGLQVPLGLAAGIMLLRRRAAGVLLAAIMLINTVCMGAALTAMVLWSAADANTSAWAAAPFALFWLTGVGLAVAFFSHTISMRSTGSGRGLGQGGSGLHAEGVDRPSDNAFR